MVPPPPSDDFEEGPAVSREVSGTSGSLAVSVFFAFVWSSESTATFERAALLETVSRVMGASAEDGATSTCTESVP